MVRKLNCNHQFHKECLKPYLERKTFCPMCRAPVINSLSKRSKAFSSATAAAAASNTGASTTTTTTTGNHVAVAVAATPPPLRLPFWLSQSRSVDAGVSNTGNSTLSAVTATAANSPGQEDAASEAAPSRRNSLTQATQPFRRLYAAYNRFLGVTD